MVGDKYNGWANRSTWNVVLWFGNDEGLYRMMLGRRRELGGKFNADSAEDLARETWPTGKTPDDDRMGCVDWEEVARSWNED